MASMDLLLCALFFVVAVLYTTVGHAGASGYLAVMGLVGVAPEVMRPTALLLNIVVASFTTYRFRAARFFDARALIPLAAASIPCAFLGGTVQLPSHLYQAAVGLVLLLSAAVLVGRAYSPRFQGAERAVRVPLAGAVLLGAAIGLLSGLTGTGGGIFLSPVILLAGWAGPKATAGIAAPFIMVNSIAGLLGSTFATRDIPESMFAYAACALLGALVGTWLGIHRLAPRGLIVTLGVVMTIAGLKLVGRAL